MNKDNIVNEDIFECKLYITDLETNKNSKEINITDIIFDDDLEFEFGDYEDDDYSQLPYKDFKYFINDYSVTFYSPQYHKAVEEIERLNNIINELEYYLEKIIIDSKAGSGMQYYYKQIYDYLKELKEGKE